MEPPSPPSPPSGPPLGMNFSRRKLMQPLPPSPALTVMDTSSTNFILLPLMRGWKERPTLQTKKPRRKTGLSGSGLASAGYDTHVATVELTLDFELDHAVSLGEQSVILAHANVLRSEEHTSELQSRPHLVCRLLLEKKKNQEYNLN